MRLGLIALALGLFAEAHAHRPLKPSAFWPGLDPQRSPAPARGVVALRTPGAPRVRIAGGAFTMGSTPIELTAAVRQCRAEVLGLTCSDEALFGRSPLVGWFRAELPAHPVVLSPFEIDRTEVSVRAYARCVAAGACAPPGFSVSDPRFAKPDLPVTLVTWDDAASYCRWNHARLPTEAEWELAARGNEGRTYPWGEIYNPHLANHGAYAPDETDATDGYVGLAPVEAFSDGATPEGVLQLAGNVAEWVSDYLDPDPEGFGYKAALLPPDGRPSHNPQGASSGLGHVVRGGSYAQGAAWQRGAARGFLSIPRSSDVGFRCARGAGA